MFSSIVVLDVSVCSKIESNYFLFLFYFQFACRLKSRNLFLFCAFFYLRANWTAQRPVTGQEWEKRNRNKILTNKINTTLFI
jgi:hypothetical protein